MSDQIFYLFSALLLGLVIGALIMYFATGSNKDSEQTIAKLEKELENYQQDVVDHFEQTADLVDGMTKSYKKVFDHLGKSARKLMSEEQIQQQLESRRGNKVTLEYLTEFKQDKVTKHEKADVLDDDQEDVETTLNEPEIVENNNTEDKESDKPIADEKESIEEISTDTPESEESNEEIAQVEEESSNKEDNSEAKELSEDDLEKEVEQREKHIYS